MAHNKGIKSKSHLIIDNKLSKRVCFGLASKDNGFKPNGTFLILGREINNNNNKNSLFQEKNENNHRFIIN